MHTKLIDLTSSVPTALRGTSTLTGPFHQGQHNNNQDGRRTLIVSSQQLTCVDRRSNKNDRSRPGLFACGKSGPDPSTLGFPLSWVVF